MPSNESTHLIIEKTMDEAKNNRNRTIIIKKKNIPILKIIRLHTIRYKKCAYA